MVDQRLIIRSRHCLSPWLWSVPSFSGWQWQSWAVNFIQGMSCQ